MATIKKDYSSAGIPGNYERGNPIPLDTTEVWYSLSDAEKYASTGETAYVGQIIKVVDVDKNDNIKSVKCYVIADTAGTLKELANDDSKLSLSGGTVDGTITATKFVGPLEGNADTATTAAECTGNAATATTAAECTGNAATATTATKLSSSDGSATQPVYFKDGKPEAIDYTIEKSVPSDAKFTDTTYTFNGAVSTIKDDNLTASRALISNSSGKVAVSDVTSTELGYLDGVTSNVQTQLNCKQSTITGAASSITDSNLTASRVLVSNASGKVAVHTITGTKLGYLSGVTSDIQTQINNKAPMYEYCTDDPGSGSSLESGKLCFIYEYE